MEDKSRLRRSIGSNILLPLKGGCMPIRRRLTSNATLGKPKTLALVALIRSSFLTCINTLLASNYETLRRALHSAPTAAPTAAIGQQEALTWIDSSFRAESQHFDSELIDFFARRTSVELGHGQPFHVLDKLIEIVQPSHHSSTRASGTHRALQ
jgi:hypothetical protein